MKTTPQREFWNGPPERLPDAFRMTKPKADHTLLTTVCETWTHPFGWELRLQIDGQGLQVSSVARSAGEMVGTVERWREATIEEGWDETQ